MQTQLCHRVHPYLQICAIFTITPPPSLYDSRRSRRYRFVLFTTFFIYVLSMLLLGFYVTYSNIVGLFIEVNMYQLEDFTIVMGIAQKVTKMLMLLIIYLNMLIYYAHLGRLYEHITILEQDIAQAAQGYGELQQRYSFRCRLAIQSGLLLLFIIVMVPRVTYPGLVDFISWRSGLATECILLIMQLKTVEYCIFVQLVQELLFRLRHTLQQVQLELTQCQHEPLFQALCRALRENQLLLSRIWSVVDEIESYFKLPMLFLVLYNGLSILHMANWAYIQSINPLDCCRYSRIGIVIVLLIDLLVPCGLTQCCINTYNSFKGTLHSMRCPCLQTTLTMRVREYILQMEHLKLLFTCGGFFDINIRFFAGLVFTISTYVIILIQFKMQADLQEKFLAQLRINLTEKALQS